VSKSIEESFRVALETVEKQIETKGAANSEDVEKLQMWQALLGVKHEAEKQTSAKKVG
jgi:hypothetical protein|tara:strand:+ start:839 stop:1012 length:174 start_codon:yes stop_codon:yes gene_type:complete